MPTDARHDESILRSLEERLAMLSVLQELTAAALALFDPGGSLDDFLDRLAARLLCSAALCIELPAGDGPPVVAGCAGLPSSARGMDLSVLRGCCADAAAWAAAPLPIPELSGARVTRWAFSIGCAHEDGPAWVLLLFFDGPPAVPARYHRLVQQLAQYVRAALEHRATFARALDAERGLRRLNAELVRDAQEIQRTAAERKELLAREQAARASAEALAHDLARQQQWLQTVLDLMPIAMVFAEPGTGRVLFTNKAADELAGGSYPHAASVADYAAAFRVEVDGRPLAPEQMPLARAARGERLAGELMEYHTPQGVRAVVVSCETLPAMHGHGATIVAQALDVTPIKAAEAALRATTQRYRSLLRAIPDLMFLLRRDGTFVDFHAEHREDLLLPPEEFLGANARDIGLPPGVTERLLAAIERALTTGELPWFEYTLPIRGEPRDYEGRVAVSGPDEVLLIVREITARKAAERELAALTRELEQRVVERTAELAAANRELESFSYSVSHDLRAPLRAIDGFCQMLLDETRERLDERERGYLARVRTASQHMAQLIDALLELSRVTRSEMRREPVDLSAMARAILADLRRASPGREVEAVVAPGVRVEGDPRLLRVVLENLLENAWKFTTHTPRARVEFGVTDRDGQRAYFVRDNGAGFDMAYVRKLFGAFQRLHSTREFEGTGIGLATVQRIVHRHGGRVWADAQVGSGATFYFTL